MNDGTSSQDERRENALLTEALGEFCAAVRGDVLSDPLSLALCSTDASIFQIRPQLVILPLDNADVVAAVKLAAKYSLPLTPRGGASGLAGECLTGGVAIDLSRHCTAILEINDTARTTTVQAGCILGDLNEVLTGHGLIFGPDPASASRAAIGGVIANNSTGAHSIRYGHASDNLHWLEAVLADGTTAKFFADGHVESDEASELRERIKKRVPELLNQWRSKIEADWPKTNRNRAGYDVRRAMNANGSVNWCRLLAGSEGTLVIFTSACLALAPLPRVKALVQLNYRSLVDMAKALPAIAATGISACELMDRRVLAMARQAHGRPHPHLPAVEASLLVEHAGSAEKIVLEDLERTLTTAKAAGGLVNEPVKIINPAAQAELWAIRKNAEPLLFRGRNAPQPVPFIEDVAVPVDKMADYLTGLEKIFRAESVSVSYYAHAGHGELHIRPFLDLHEHSDRQRMVRIAEKTFELAWQCGGTISGEHGCGRIRSGWLSRQYGQLYELLRQIKAAFDPNGLFNPGNLITDQPPQELMTTNLRFDRRAKDDPAETTALAWGEKEMIGEAEACNGCAECNTREERVRMCPVFRAVGSQPSSPRGMANAVRHAITGLMGEAENLDGQLQNVAAMCIHCRSCQFECPSAVNVPKLMLELQAREGRGANGQQKSLPSRLNKLSHLACAAWPLSNLLMKVPGAGLLAEKLTGLDHRRRPPRFARGRFTRRAKTPLPSTGEGLPCVASAEQGAPEGRVRVQPLSLEGRGWHEVPGEGATPGEGAPKERVRVLYFLDLFADCHDHALAQAAIDVLKHNDIEVIVPKQDWSALPAITCGDLASARKAIEANLPALARAVEEGCTILCSEPAAAIALSQDWPSVLPSQQMEKIANATDEVMCFLWELWRARKLKTDFKPLQMHLAYHAPCHMRALRNGACGLDVARLIPGLTIDTLPNACCGMAGTFGLEHRNYDLSLNIGRRLLSSFRDSRAPVGLTECSACRMQMEHAAGKPVLHPIKLLAKAYGY